MQHPRIGHHPAKSAVTLREMRNNPVFDEFIGYWQLSEEMIAKASKDDLAETARILAMQAAHMTRKYGEQPLPDLRRKKLFVGLTRATMVVELVMSRNAEMCFKSLLQ